MESNKLKMNKYKIVFNGIDPTVLSSDLQGGPQSSEGTLLFDFEVSKAICLEEYSQSSRSASSAKGLTQRLHQLSLPNSISNLSTELPNSGLFFSFVVILKILFF